jgi:hypothetical protein
LSEQFLPILQGPQQGSPPGSLHRAPIARCPRNCCTHVHPQEDCEIQQPLVIQHLVVLLWRDCGHYFRISQ